MQDHRIYCGQLGLADRGQEVCLAGWVDALRDHGEVLFIHLRDRSGIVQVVFSPDSSPLEVCQNARQLRNEFCITISGHVIKRAEGTENPHLETGEIEVVADTLAIYSDADTLPFPISEKAMIAGTSMKKLESVSEDLRLQYRYLDLRRPSMQRNFIKRHQIFKCIRDFLDEQGFIEIETPILTKSTPEGARDYLVPSRLHERRFYALPQSPQLFKQLLMVSGFERYFQLARCFRDEDLRPNRQPEFTQLDIEASFIDEEFIYELLEELTVRMFRVGHIELPRPFPRMTHTEAIDTTGSDRPDLRFGLRFIEATDIFGQTSYGIFKQVLERGGRIKGITIKGQSDRLSKNVLQNEYAKEIVPSFGAKGMTWMRVAGEELESNIVQFFSETEKQAIIERFGAQSGDVIIMIADPSYEVVTSVLGLLRIHLAHRLELIAPGLYCPVWITDFPLFEAADEGITSSHHPFTAPDHINFDPADRDQLLSLRSRAYDLVVNGEELGGGSIRINSKQVQNKIFQALNLTETDIKDKFGFFLHAFDYGIPPHGGLALGMDRVVAMILGTDSIREVIAFPKNRSAFCPLTQAPSGVSRDQLAEIGLLDPGNDKRISGIQKEGDLIDTLSWVSRIALGDDEKKIVAQAVKTAQKMAKNVSAIQMDDDPLFSVMQVSNRMRRVSEAKRHPVAQRGEIFKNAPAVKGDFFKVASILE
ncbi:MAG: aspartate--tRNA ligase [Syntrophales bacterium]|jgi:aspartyl-tRNA synthetase|nr:aspartate--tRNA ligase [Syntrophales bacterium]